MKTVVFVDDEQSVIDGLRRMLRHYRKEWNMLFLNSGTEAISFCELNSVDVIISDIRMPIMDGVQLLAKVRDLSPSTIRIALSGYADHEMMLDSIQVTHQFIAKPTDKSTISTVIERSISLPNSLCDDKIKFVLGKINALPTLPHVYKEIKRELNSDDFSLQRIGIIVENDISASTNLLKVVNSAFFGLIVHIESPAQAVSILGVDVVKNLILTNSLFAQASVKSKNIDKLTEINNTCIKMGALATSLAKISNLSNEQKDYCQIAAMMTGLGELVANEYASELENITTSDDYYEQLGSYLLGMWGMTLDIVDAVRWHQTPSLIPSVKESPLTIVHVTWAILKSIEKSGKVDLESNFFDMSYLSHIVSQSELDNWVQIGNDFKNIEETS